MSASLHFTVFGKPAQMGSKKAFVRGGRAIITDDNSDKRKQWANAVSSQAAEAMGGMQLVHGAVDLDVAFWFARPKSHFGTGKNSSRLKESAPDRHIQTPDLDKLLRCLCDALTGVVYRDDSQVFRVTCQRCWTCGQEKCDVSLTFNDWSSAYAV